MAISDTLLNTLFDGRYRIVRKLGTGGMANVYLAEDEVLGRRVAIKILNDRHAGDDQFIERFRREAKNAASLSHPNIVSIYDRGEAEGTYYIAMEYLDGRSLKELIVARGPAPIHLAVDYARQILAAIRFAHRHGIVHRDIKPHNVLVDGEGRLKVTDFGIARAGVSQMTEAGSIIGTAQYLSPEQAQGAPVDQTSDISSVCVILYEPRDRPFRRLRPPPTTTTTSPGGAHCGRGSSHSSSCRPRSSVATSFIPRSRISSAVRRRSPSGTIWVSERSRRTRRSAHSVCGPTRSGSRTPIPGFPRRTSFSRRRGRETRRRRTTSSPSTSRS